MGELDAPEGILPVSTERSSNPTRCVTLSRFRQTTNWPAANFAGFGLKDAEPTTPTMSITTGDPDDNEGPAGFAVLELPCGPQPQTLRPNTRALTAAEHVRTGAVLSFDDMSAGSTLAGRGDVLSMVKTAAARDLFLETVVTFEARCRARNRQLRTPRTLCEFGT